ncbi:hypothetical protein SeLEV6574_g02868 [Synchytrium endobioticum]|uniref:Uncharacterized protein n=1 Tax=Synchytrium endobioticum TaxID=286115 RepID=A0A507D730_9FUNG|nr:hypothetical protein SeLEV6574_g02868 [Synchytrium endobioticum]
MVRPTRHRGQYVFDVLDKSLVLRKMKLSADDLVVLAVAQEVSPPFGRLMKVVHPGLARARVERLARRIENSRKIGLRASIDPSISPDIVITHRLIIENSIESRIIQLQEKKKALFQSTVGKDMAAMDKLSEEDLRFLFVL